MIGEFQGILSSLFSVGCGDIVAKTLLAISWILNRRICISLWLFSEVEDSFNLATKNYKEIIFLLEVEKDPINVNRFQQFHYCFEDQFSA